MSATKDRATIREAMRIIKKAAIAEKVAQCIEAVAEQQGVTWQEIVSRKRGCPKASRARVVAMNACVCLGVPMLTTAKAFRRRRRTVHNAIEIGRPGREQRDEDVLRSVRLVVAKVKETDRIEP